MPRSTHCRCLDYGISNDVVYVVLEYFQGKSLAQVVAEEGALSPSQAAAAGAQVAQALGIIHRAGFVFRDVKPENILRCSERNQTVYRLVDFGSTTGIDGCLFGATSSRLPLGDSTAADRVYSDIDVDGDRDASSDDAYRYVYEMRGEGRDGRARRAR